MKEKDLISGKESQGFNYGLALLRIWMCFEVVIVHFKDWSGVTNDSASLITKILLRYCFVAVPVFMLSSFALIDVSNLAHDNSKIKHRFYRLLVPHFFWAFAYFGIYKLLFFMEVADQKVGISELVIQLLTGHSYNQTEWFQIELIVLTSFYIVIFRLLSKQIALGFTIFIGCLALFLQYSGVNGTLFENVLMHECFQHVYAKVLIGRLVEMIPYSSLGIVFCNYNVLNKLKEEWENTIIGAAMLLLLLLKYPVFVEIERHYSYSGIAYIAFSVVSIMFFYCLPLSWLPNAVKLFIRFLGRYTMAVYFIHRLIGTLLYHTSMKTLLGLKIGSLYDCIIIFVFSIMSAWLIERIPIKIVKDSVK